MRLLHIAGFCCAGVAAIIVLLTIVSSSSSNSTPTATSQLLGIYGNTDEDFDPTVQNLMHSSKKEDKLVAWAKRELDGTEGSDLSDDDVSESANLQSSQDVPLSGQQQQDNAPYMQQPGGSPLLAIKPVLADAAAATAAAATGGDSNSTTAAAAAAAAAGSSSSGAASGGSASASSSSSSSSINFLPPMDDWLDLDVTSQDALDAAEYVFKRFDEDRKFCKKPAATSFVLLVAQHQLNAQASEKYMLVMLLGTTEYQVHLEAYSDDEAHPNRNPDSPDATKVKNYHINYFNPLPCSAAEKEAELNTPASSQQLADSINALNVGWKARHHQKFQGLTAGDFRRYRLGAVMPSPEEMIPLSPSQMLDTVPIPDNFDSRTQGKTCVAFTIKDQGDCGSCYAQAASTSLSARACLASNAKYNFDLSPQEMMDCTNGCEGGDATMVYQVMAVRGVTESYCDPYVQRQGPCGNACISDINGVRWKVVPEQNYKFINKKTVGDANAEAQMQLEVMKNGPAWVAFAVYSDFSTYASGVYQKTASATMQGYHAVTLIGWGVDNGVKYWLCQNSWGDDWGDHGIFKIQRGVDMAQIETFGINVASMSVNTICPGLTCKNGGSYLNDCSACFCHDPWQGKDCGTCVLKCAAAGTLIKTDTQCSCQCMQGYSGMMCEEGVEISANFQCPGSGIDTKFYWNFRDAPFQGSFAIIYPSNAVPFNATAGWNPGYVKPISRLCGDPAAGKVCPTSGSITLPQLQTSTLAVGNYSVYYAAHRGYNEFKQSRGYSNPLLVGIVTVTATCDKAALQTVTQNSDQRTAREAKQLQTLALKDASSTIASTGSSSSDRVVVQLTCSGDVTTFTDSYKAAFCSRLANALSLPQTSVTILSVKAASVIADVAIQSGNGVTAKTAADNLNSMVSRKDSRISTLGIQSCTIESSASLSASFSWMLTLLCVLLTVAFLQH